MSSVSEMPSQVDESTDSVTYGESDNNNLAAEAQSTAINDVEEKLAFERVVNSFVVYRRHCLEKLSRGAAVFKSMPDEQKRLLSHYSYQLKRRLACIDHNDEVLKVMIRDAEKMFQNANYSDTDDADTTPVKPRNMDLDKLQSVLRHFTRDWSSLGATERDYSYGRCLRCLEALYPDVSKRSDVKVLVPGAGLGRLSLEIVNRNFETQGNEFSYFMLICSNFILNKCCKVDEYVLYPYVTQGSNVLKDEDQCLAVRFPDIDPRAVPKGSKFSMSAGDFLDVYHVQQQEWDCVVTAFFIDTAHNIIDYVELIFDILKPGGHWINFGPLLYHFEDMANESSLELSYEQLKEVIQQVGFEYIEEEEDCETPYAQSPCSMLQYIYNPLVSGSIFDPHGALVLRMVFEGWSVFKRLFACDCYSCRPFSCCKSCFGSKHNRHQYRTIIPNHAIPADTPASLNPNSRYPGNRIKTTKYSIITFLPKNLFEQFHRFANLYFIFIVLLNWVPQIQAFGRQVSMLPILFVLGVTAVKDAYEDIRRWRSDQKINRSHCRAYSREESRYKKFDWQELRVGDMVHLSCNEIVPADILLLRSSDNSTGSCFVETSNLDGESNLKQRQVVGGLLKNSSKFHPSRFKSTLECELPNNHIMRFNGFLLHENGIREPVNRNNLLLRGCAVKNTDFIEGIVVYAGHDTKAMLNNSGPRYKRSKLERLMNWDIIWCVLILLMMCFVGAIAGGIWLGQFSHLEDVLFLPFEFDDITKINMEAFINFWSYIIILQVMIPISLYVTMELVKLGQIFFMSQDIEMYDPSSDKRLLCRALNIPEELGQIQYVMSDKTGTLTENKMIFRRCTIGHTDYGPAGVNLTSEQKPVGEEDESLEHVTVNTELARQMFEIGSEPPNSSGRRKTMYNFFINMAICNTVVVSSHPHYDKMNESGLYLNDTGRYTSTEPLTRDNTPAQTPLPAHAPSPQVGFINSATDSAIQLNSNADKDSRLSLSPHPVSFYTSQESNSTAATNTMELGPLRRDLNGTDGVPHRLPQVNTVPMLSADTSSPHVLGVQNGDIRTSTPVPPSSGEPEPNRPETLDVSANSKGMRLLPPLGKRIMPSFARLRSSFNSSRSASPAPSPGFRNPIYEAESPDELALVRAAAAYGVRLAKRQGKAVTLEMPDGMARKYDVLHSLPFDSVRKRMSIIVREPTTESTILFSKGADSVMMDLLSEEFKSSRRGQMYLYKAQEYLNLYASYGLRTLCLVKRVLDPDLYERWAAEHLEAEVSLDDRDELLFESAMRIEQDFELLGVTGIEDRLQDGVPETIASLREAGIQVWVLTGDKIETAVNIAYACRLFVYGMELIQLSARTEDDVLTLLEHHLEGIEAKDMESDLDSPGTSGNPHGRGLVVDGRTLAYCLSPSVEDTFLRLLQHCTAVLCCRSTPLQKAHVVKLIKEKLSVLVLAIGDGANDVGMIQAADVGVGISGQEGMQAVMASDYAISRFKFLNRLLLVHGHWCYHRLALMVVHFFYKNAVFVFTVFWFQMYNGWSAQVMMDPLYLMLYNLIFTSLPPIIFAVLDKDASDKLLIGRPPLYQAGRENSLYQTHSYWLSIFNALWQSLVIFFVPYLMYQETDGDMWLFGTVIMSALVICNQLDLLAEVHSWNILLMISLVGSIFVFYAFALAYNIVAIECCSPAPPYYIAERLFSDPYYWLAIFLISVMALLPKLTFRCISHTLRPSPVLCARLLLKQKQSSNRLSSKRLGFFSSSKTQKVGIVPDETQQSNEDTRC